MWYAMKRGWMAVGVAAVCVLSGMAADLPPLNVPVCDKPPMLDGTLDDPAWQAAAKIAHLYKIKSNTPAPETSLRLMRDNAWLYIGADCRNPNMAHVMQLAYAHDGPVHTDDALEVALRPTPAPDAVYYHFMLNFAGIMADQRCDRQGLRDRSWNPPWRAMTQRQPDGWTATIAIPLFYLGVDDLSKMSLNICRNLMRVDLDAYGAKQSETRESSMLRSENKGSFHNFKNFVAVSGMDGFKPIVPFAPQIQKAAITGVQHDGGTNYYSMELTLATATPETGTAQLKVIENFGDGDVETYVQTVELHGTMDLSLKIPTKMLCERRVNPVLTDPNSGNLLAAMVIDDTSALRVLQKVFVGRSYYTSEESAEIRVELGLPGSMLPDVTLIVELGDAKVVDLNGLSSEMTLAIPLSKLALGNNKVRVRVLIDGRELAAQTLNIVRLEPRPGYETKADFIKGVVLKDNQPYFPLGLFGHTLQYRLGARGSTEDDENIFRFLAEDIGLNTIVRMKRATNTVAFLNLAEKYGLNVITWTCPEPNPIGWKPGMWPPPPCDLPLVERLAIQQKEYDAEEPKIIADTKILRDYKNFIIYYNVDEPNLVNPEERIVGAERYWNTVTPLDPYRPHLLVYSAHIPAGEKWTKWSDILGFDIYPKLFRTDAGIRIEPGLSTVYYAWQLRERCRSDNKIMWFVPISNIQDPCRTPIGMDKLRMLCQAYSAIIYGVKGLLYFGLSNTIGEEAWDALRVIFAEVKEMTPALVNGDIPQQIKYTPDDYHPAECQFPDVNAAVFQYPDGDYLLLAVNIRPHAVDTMFKVGGLQHAARMFVAESQSNLALDEESFTDKIEPYGVRAYRIKISEQAVPVQVAVAMTPIEDERAPHVDVQDITRQLMVSKNHMPNPCFERQFNPGIPDFYRPLFERSTDPFWGQPGKSDWYIDETTRWNGKPSLRMLRRKYDLGGHKTYGLLLVFYPPAADKPMTLTFSCYAKSDDPRASIWFRIYDSSRHRVKILTADWQRHHFTFDLPPGSGANLGARMFLMVPSEGSVIWISGLQVEAGEQPTEFQDDSILRTVAPDDPNNLLLNPGAESATAKCWDGLETRRGEFGIRRGMGRTGDYAFYWRGQSSGIKSDWVAIDTNKTYALSGCFKSESGSITGVTFGLVMADAQQRDLKSWNIFSVKGTSTELTAPCRADDRALRIKDGQAWKTGIGFVAAFGAGENELTHNVTPGIEAVCQDGNVWMVTLKDPCGLEMPAGTAVHQNQAGNNGIFFPGAIRAVISNEWTEFKGEIKAKDWWPGTAYARVVVIGPGLQQGKTEKVLLMDDFDLRIRPEL